MARILELMQLSPTMTSGTFVRWLKKPGDAVSPDDAVAEVETDKAVMEMQAFDTGLLLATFVEKGEQIPVGAPIAVVGQMGEEVSDLINEGKKRLAAMREGPAPAASTPAAATSARTSPESVMTRAAASAMTAEDLIPSLDDTGSVDADTAAAESIHAAHASSHGAMRQPAYDAMTGEPISLKSDRAMENLAVPISTTEHWLIDEPSLNGLISLPAHLSLARSSYRTRHPISPLARRLAEGYRIDVSLIHPADGRRVKASDVEDYIKRRSATPGGAEPPPPDRKVEISGMRRVIATRLSESKTHIPHYYLTAEFDATALSNLREEINASLEEGRPRLSVNDFIVRACALALKKHPVVNSSWRGDHIVSHGRIDVGIAVALDQGLITPYVRNADRLQLGELSTRIREVVKKAKERKLRPEEYTDGTFTVSNLGMYGIREFSAIINEPEAAIMAVGGIFERPGVKDGQIVIRKTITVTLSCDHRVVDGAEGASFLATFSQLMEHPNLLLI